MKQLRSKVTALGVGLATTVTLAVALAPVANAQSARDATYLGATSITTARGVAATLTGAGVSVAPVDPSTARATEGARGPRLTVRFPVTSSDVDLAAGTGDVLHSGGITFSAGSASVEIGKFDIDLAAGKVYATEVNGAAGRVAVLDLDLTNLVVTMSDKGATILTGVGAALDPEAAGVLNSAFGTALPTAAPLLNFGRARVVLT